MPTKSNSVGRLLFHAGALGAAGLFAVPLLWVLAFSLRQPGMPPPTRIEWLPNPVVWANYVRIFQIVPLGLYTINSLTVTAVAVPLTLVAASWAGFAMAQFPPNLRKRLVLLAVLLLMVPASALWLPRFIIFRTLWLVDTYWALIAPALMGSSPFFVLLFYWTFRRVPIELFESAQLDGASALRVWWSIALPLARPTIIAVTVLAFSLYWSDFVSPLLYLKTEAYYTLPVGLQLLQQMDRTNWPFLMAGAVLITAPVLLLFTLIQHYLWPEERRERVTNPGQ
jgi:multiple sugar transport system permease protein